MHLLEMAKTAWNAYVTCNPGAALKTDLLKQTRTYLSWSKHILAMIGPEGDDGGPLRETEVLEGLLGSIG